MCLQRFLCNTVGIQLMYIVRRQHRLHLGCSAARDTALQRYCISTGGGNWIVEAAAYDHWMRSKQDFVFFTWYTS